MNKQVKKSLIISGSVVGGIVALFLLLYLILALIGCGMYGEARKARQYVCDIAGIKDSIAPQGLTYSKEKDVYIQTGYDKSDVALLYLVENNKPRRVKLLNEKGETLKSHAGGVTCTKDYVYIANGSTLYTFSLDELYNAGNNAVAVKRVFYVDNNAAFCYSTDDTLYVGEFYRAGNYETDQAHYFTTPNGDENKAIVSVYPLDANGLLADEGVQPYPTYRISITGLVQGFAVEDGVYMLSRSYGLTNSNLEYHSAPVESGTTQAVTFKKGQTTNPSLVEVPLYYLDTTTLYKTLVLPSFSEDMTVVNGRVLVSNEASANKYFVGKLFGSHKIYSYPVYKKS